MSDSNPVLIQPSLPSSNVSTPAVPLILIHDGGGTVFQYYLLSPLSRPVYGIANPHFESGEPWPGGLHEMAAHYASLIQAAIPSGQILLGGWSLGGYLALEVAHIIAQNRQHEVVGLIMIDSPLPHKWKDNSIASISRQDILRFVEHTVQEKRKLQVQKCFSQAVEMLQAWTLPSWSEPCDVKSNNSKSTKELRPSAQPPPIVLLRAVDRVPWTGGSDGAEDPIDEWRESRELGWENYDQHFIRWVLGIPGHHFNIFDWQKLDCISTQVRQACEILEQYRDTIG